MELNLNTTPHQVISPVQDSVSHLSNGSGNPLHSGRAYHSPGTLLPTTPLNSLNHSSETRRELAVMISSLQMEKLRPEGSLTLEPCTWPSAKAQKAPARAQHTAHGGTLQGAISRPVSLRKLFSLKAKLHAVNTGEGSPRAHWALGGPDMCPTILAWASWAATEVDTEMSLVPGRLREPGRGSHPCNEQVICGQQMCPEIVRSRD
jgi:hypothetical protein